MPSGSIRIRSSKPPDRVVGRTMPTVPSFLSDVMMPVFRSNTHLAACNLDIPDTAIFRRDSHTLPAALAVQYARGLWWRRNARPEPDVSDRLWRVTIIRSGCDTATEPRKAAKASVMRA
jgi:hypothetical protein